MLHSVGLNLAAHTRLPTFFHPSGLADGYFPFVVRGVHNVPKDQQAVIPALVVEKPKKLVIQGSGDLLLLSRTLAGRIPHTHSGFPGTAYSFTSLASPSRLVQTLAPVVALGSALTTFYHALCGSVSMPRYTSVWSCISDAHRLATRGRMGAPLWWLVRLPRR